LDWYYGLRKLLAEGARPDVVVVTLNAGQLLSDSLRGDYSASRLIQASDLFAAAHDARLSLTQGASQVLAHFSLFYSTRVEIRNWVLSMLVPGMQELKTHLAPVNRPRFMSEQVQIGAAGRLRAMNALASEYGARLVLLVPASLSGNEPVSGLAAAGRATGIDVLIPAAPGALPVSYFADGFHLNATGAQQYTKLLAPVLRACVTAPPPQPPKFGKE
jgi:hypothetical protein